jgi:hypothetical protein
MSTTATITIKGDLARRSLAGSSHHDREQSTKSKLPRLARENSIREILYTTLGNVLKRRESKRQFKEEETQVEHKRMERRNSIQKSLDTFMDENEEDILKTIIASNACSRNKPRGRYLRRGSVTKHQIDPKVHELQPNCRATRSDEDMENDTSAETDVEDRRRRYLRRGSVTKYVLDANVDGLQPTRILEDNHNRPRRPLPPPPEKNSSRDLMTNVEPVLTEECENDPMKPTSREGRESKTKKHQIDPIFHEMQPDCRATQSNEGMENDTSGETDAGDRRRQNLSPGSSTKCVLEVTMDGLQPAKLVEDSHNLPRRPLPPPSPMENSNPHLMANEAPILMEECENVRIKPTSREGRESKSEKHQIDPKVHEMQPNGRATPSEGMENDTSGETKAEDRRRRYLRRGSVTKYVLEAPVDGLQPTNILEDNYNLPKRPLPPPPMKMTNEEPILTEECENLPMKPTSRKVRKSKTKRTKRTKKTKKRRRSVSFGMVTIREFPLVLGHHPIMHSHRRGRKLALSVPERARRLFAAGHSLQEIGEATRAALQVKKERADSLGHQNWDRFNIFMESASRALRTMVDAPPNIARARMA